jgi:ribosomal protein L36
VLAANGITAITKPINPTCKEAGLTCYLVRRAQEVMILVIVKRECFFLPLLPMKRFSFFFFFLVASVWGPLLGTSAST